MLLDKLQAIKERYIYLEEQMADPELIADMSRYTKVSKEYKDLQLVVRAYEEYKQLLGNIQTAREMLKDESPDMREMAEMELEELEPR